MQCFHRLTEEAGQVWILSSYQYTKSSFSVEATEYAIFDYAEVLLCFPMDNKINGLFPQLNSFYISVQQM